MEFPYHIANAWCFASYPAALQSRDNLEDQGSA